VSLLLATPAVIFWFWLVILPARVAILCPEGCKCEQAGYYVDCSSTSLNSVPLIHLTGVRGFSLYENNITLLKNDSFVSLTELDLLEVRKCGLRTIELGAFNRLTELRELFIEGNEISEIIPGTFENMNRLQYLGLYRNKLEHVDSAVFSGLVNLEYINFGETQIKYFHPDTF
jgi:Leucine-rich repeat (LRR) protein